MGNFNEKSIDNLMHLLSICNDGKQGYKTAAEDVDSTELKTLFSMYSIQRAEFEMQLKKAIHQLGGNPDNETGGSIGTLHRVWMDIKTTFTKNDDAAILEACVTGEKSALEAYDKGLTDLGLDAEIATALADQRTGIADCLKNIQILKDQYAN
ncbi:ferritin-like domain-containing protein [Arcticibacter eurypsychrophilus]|uniref:ferritin-like domain-containing protein n=1 Tax=Arcticibacter eurypsychrophilus TaxID=1434752 RepID=UPI00084DBDE1|nr:PA2169 family four-helix-bundle protein [Arcticibacter eurypsychrophilus]